MARRSPMLLWRHLAADLAKLVALTSLILVVIIAFALSIKLLADGKIDLGGAIIVMGLAALPMLQYALPFAGGFAATLTYHRFTSENEAGAAMAGGVSHRALLAPAIAIGLVLLLAMLLLAHLAIPHVLRSMEHQVRSDLTGVLQRTIERGDSIEFGGLQIYADDMLALGPDEAIGAIDRFQLQGVLAIHTDPDQNVDGYIIAQTVNAWMFQEEGDDGPVLTIQLEFGGATATWDKVNRSKGEGFFTNRIPIGESFVEDPKFNTFAELNDLREHPENMRNIESLRRTLALTLAQRDLLMAIRTRLQNDGRVVFERPGGERVVLSAASLVHDGRRWELSTDPPGGALRVDRSQSGLTPFVQITGDAWLELEEDQVQLKSPIPTPTASLVLLAPRTIDSVSAGRPSPHQEVRIESLRLVSNAPTPSEPMGVSESLTTATNILDAGEEDLRDEIARAASRLDYRHRKLQRDVTSRQHERAAHALASLLTMLTGAIAALRRPSVMPLPVYLISFFPALAAIITIDAGQSLTLDSGWPGLLLLWGGLAALAGFAWFEYTKLVRH